MDGGRTGGKDGGREGRTCGGTAPLTGRPVLGSMARKLTRRKQAEGGGREGVKEGGREGRTYLRGNGALDRSTGLGEHGQEIDETRAGRLRGGWNLDGGMVVELWKEEGRRETGRAVSIYSLYLLLLWDGSLRTTFLTPSSFPPSPPTYCSTLAPSSCPEPPPQE